MQTTTSSVPSGIEAQVCNDLTQRQLIGIKKYGTTVAKNPLPLRDWLQHAYEETLDNAVYLRRAIAEIDSKSETNKETIETLEALQKVIEAYKSFVEPKPPEPSKPFNPTWPNTWGPARDSVQMWGTTSGTTAKSDTMTFCGSSECDKTMTNGAKMGGA